MVVSEAWRREKVSGHGLRGRGLGGTLDTEVATQVRSSEIDVFDLDLHVVDLPVRLLRPFEFGAGAEEGSCCICL